MNEVRKEEGREKEKVGVGRDGALMGVGSFKPCSSKSTISLQLSYHQIFVNPTL
jgi:hypothetical protein